MAKLSLTSEGRSGLTYIALLPESSFETLMESLRRPAEDIGGKAYIERIRDALAVDLDQARNVYISLIALQRFGEGPSSISPIDVVDSLSDDPKITGAGIAAGSLLERFNATQLTPAFAAFAKAGELLVQNERNYISARGLTDLRPLFGEDVAAGPVLFVIQHELQIKFKRKDREESEEFFVAMDERDIDNLIETLSRLKQKTDALAKHLERANVPYLKTNRY